MRHPTAVVLAVALLLTGCGAGPGDSRGEEDETVRAMPADDGGVATGGNDGAIGGLNTETRLEPEIARAWSGVRVEVIDTTTGETTIVDATLGEAVDLGDSGLTLFADLFIPDFLMDELGIHSRSAEAINPAARIVISEDGVSDYHGWLFAAMPEIYPFPHDRYQVLLVEGIPAQ